MTKLAAACLFIVSLSVSAALAAGPQVFRNTDLEKYSSGVKPQAEEPSPAAQSDKQQSRETDDGAITSPKYWCDIATEAGNRVRRAEESLTRAKANRAEAWRSLSSGIRAAAVEADAKAQKEQENAEAELAEAMQDKERIQREAHEREIPAGWLRCQFE